VTLGPARAAVLTAALCLGWAAGARGDGAFPNSQNIMAPAALPHELLLGTNFGLVMSFDDGRTWTWTCEQPLNAFATLYQVGPPPANRLLAVSPQGVIRSDDLACSWSAATGVAAGAALDVFADPSDARRVLAVTTTGDGGTIYQVLASADGGASFTTPVYTAAAGDHITGVEIARSAPQTIYATLTSGSSFVPKLAQTTDGGAHWVVHDLSAMLLAGAYSLGLIAVDPVSPGKVYLRVGSRSGEALAITTDGGATASLPLTLAGGSLTAFTRLPSGSLIAAGVLGTDDVAYRSTDQGASFQMLPAPPPVRGLAARGTTLYAATDTSSTTWAVETSPDEGMTWQPMMAYPDIRAIQGCVMAACQDDCLNRAGMSQWPEEMCSAVAPSIDGGSTPVDAGGRDAGRVAAPPSSGCGCAAAGQTAPVVPPLLLSLAGLLARRRRSRKGR
jgi:MYXO-CTERM domain-containing protein